MRVILPDRLQIAAFRRRLAEAGGAMGPRVGTFGDYYQALLLRARKPVPLTTDPVIYRLLHAAVDDVSAEKGLIHYGPIAKTPGFINILRERFAELKRARLFPEDLVDMNFSNDPGLEDLAQIYLAYQTRLRALNWADPEGLSWLAVEAHEEQPWPGERYRPGHHRRL